MNTPEISVVMITMNEEKAVAKVIGDIQQATAGRSVEIVVVDSSRDRTPEIAADLGARVVRQFPPQGYGKAMDRALREARGAVVVTLDCDDTYPADQILPIADMVLSGECDVVNASRLERRPAAMPFSNYLANWTFAVTSWLLTGVKTTDVHSGMRSYSREVLANIEYDPSGPALPVELLLRPAVQGFRVSEIFIEYRDRIGVSTLQRWSSTVWTFKRIFRCFAVRGAAAPIARPAGRPNRV